MIKRVNKRIISISGLIIVMLCCMIVPINTQAAAKTEGYLVLVEEKDGSWSSYDNFTEEKQEGIPAIKAYDASKIIGLTYKESSKKNFTISNNKNVNTYTIGAVKYKYSNGRKTVTKKAAYAPYQSKEYKTNMIEYKSLSTLVYVKCYKAAEAGEYKNSGYQGVICLSKYNKIAKLPEQEKGIRVTTQKELVEAATDLNTAIINIASDITITEDFTYEREDNPVIINIKSGKTLTINKAFIGVGGIINNNGKIIVNGTFDRGACNLVNNGEIIVNNGGTLQSGMSDLNNNGSITVKSGAALNVVRGSVFNNFGQLSNEGKIQINDGGNMNDKGGTIINNGILDLYSYYNGDISLITGTGTINDHREAVTE